VARSGRAASGPVGGAPRRRRRPLAEKPRHVPQRTCVACRQGAAKRELVRVVRTAVGAVQIDPTGKVAGRGAYVHQDPACWDQALRRRTLTHALKIETIPEPDLAALRGYADALRPAPTG
jgi:uncharacterized protein